MNRASDRFEGLPTVRASIGYLGAMTEEPYMYYRDPPPEAGYTNVTDAPREVDVADLRSDRDRLSLLRDGIAFFDIDHGFTAFDDDGAVQSVYYPDVERMFGDLLGVDRVVAYDYSVRRPDHGPVRPAGIPVSGPARRPIKRAHGDFVRKSFIDMVSAMGERCGPDPLRGRCRAFNLWRPIQGPLTDRPLALCHPASVVPGDLVPMKQYTPQRDNYICALKHNTAHRWCYLSDMRSDEAVIFSSFDSACEDARGVVAHCAFDHPAPTPGGLPRHSIEVRVLVFGE